MCPAVHPPSLTLSHCKRSWFCFGAAASFSSLELKVFTRLDGASLYLKWRQMSPEWAELPLPVSYWMLPKSDIHRVLFFSDSFVQVLIDAEQIWSLSLQDDCWKTDADFVPLCNNAPVKTFLQSQKTSAPGTHTIKRHLFLMSHVHDVLCGHPPGPLCPNECAINLWCDQLVPMTWEWSPD